MPLRLYACGGKIEGVPAIEDPLGKLAAAARAKPGSFCLIRPDAYVAAMIADAGPAHVKAAVNLTLCKARP